MITWYSDGKYTIGTSSDLAAYQGPTNFSLPPGKTVTDVVDMAFGGSKSQTITYFRDKTYAVGKPDDLDYFFHAQAVNSNLPMVRTKYWASQLLLLQISFTLFMTMAL